MPPGGVLGRSTCAQPGFAPPTYRYIGSTAKSRDGWDSLGDLGWFDVEGYLYLADRRVDMFTVGGRNVYPAEIESALSEHPPAVLSCLAVGVPHEDLGQVPYALVHTDGDVLTEDDVKAFVAQRLADYKVPRAVEFVDTPAAGRRGQSPPIRGSGSGDRPTAGLAQPLAVCCQARAATSSGTRTSVSSRTSSCSSPG